MRFNSLSSVVCSLLSRMQRHRLATSIVAVGIVIAGLTTPHLVQAQCVQTGDDWACSGNMNGTTITAGSETNIFSFVEGVFGFLTVNGGGGSDTIDFSTFTTDVRVSVEEDYPINIYSVVQSGSLYISWTGFTTGVTVKTGSGNDTITTGDGNDTISGGAGNDTIVAGEGTNSIFGDAGSDVITSGSGSDAISGGAGNDTINAGAGDDYVTGGTGKDMLNGEAGDDVLSGGDDADTLNGGDGTDERNDKGSSCIEDVVISIEKDPCPRAEGAKSAPAAEAPMPPELCITTRTRVSLNDRGMIVVFSDFGAHNPNGMLITEIPLVSVRAVTDAEKAANVRVPLVYKDSEYALAWSVRLYWHKNHYGVVIYKDYGKTIVDDTDAICGWF